MRAKHAAAAVLADAERIGAHKHKKAAVKGIRRALVDRRVDLQQEGKKSAAGLAAHIGLTPQLSRLREILRVEPGRVAAYF